MDGHSDEDADPPEIILDIVITAPSSPEVKPSLTNELPRPTDVYDDSHDLSFQPVDILTVPATDHHTLAMSSSSALWLTPFEEAMANATLPEPGPEYFAARQVIWKIPRGPGSRSSPKRSRKLEAILQKEGPLDSDEDWAAGLDKIWKGLIGGQKLKERIALRDLVCRTPSLDP